MSRIQMTVNDHAHEVDVEPRQLLLDVLRDDLRLTGVHAGCEQGSCGACTILIDGVGVRSCLMFAVQADGASITTIEGVGAPGALHPVQQALAEHHGLQCGFCTPGVVLSAIELLARTSCPARPEIEEAMAGNWCRCTGYIGIIDAIEACAQAGAPQELAR